MVSNIQENIVFFKDKNSSRVQNKLTLTTTNNSLNVLMIWIFNLFNF